MTTPQNRYYLRSLPDFTDTDTSDGEAQSEHCSLDESIDLSDLSGTEQDDTVREVVTEERSISTGTSTTDSIDMANIVKLAHFTGEPGSRADVWLKEYDSFIQINRIPAENKAMTIQFYLDGKAKRWYHALPDATKNDYNLLTEEMRKRYNGDDGLGQGLGLWALSMMPGETSEDYISRVNSFNIGANIPENVLVGAAMKGLPMELQKIVMPQRITNLEELRVAVLLAERTLLNTSASVSAIKMSEQDSIKAQMQALTDELRELRTQVSQRSQPEARSTNYARQRGQRRPMQMQSVSHGNQGRPTYACRNCRGMVSHSLRQCPAYNKKCTYCNLMHHTEAVCERKERESGSYGNK